MLLLLHAFPPPCLQNASSPALFAFACSLYALLSLRCPIIQRKYYVTSTQHQSLLCFSDSKQHTLSDHRTHSQHIMPSGHPAAPICKHSLSNSLCFSARLSPISEYTHAPLTECSNQLTSFCFRRHRLVLICLARNAVLASSVSVRWAWPPAPPGAEHKAQRRQQLSPASSSRVRQPISSS
ncbi:hypothetical protein niasHT_006489 [Heterodera trifolii]|uniref:Uncharacterized protein n=1 Tax=Heterodera trifolii TaxID=157864 RepID=A0ABD2LU55_9BILA